MRSDAACLRSQRTLENYSDRQGKMASVVVPRIWRIPIERLPLRPDVRCNGIVICSFWDCARAANVSGNGLTPRFDRDEPETERFVGSVSGTQGLEQLWPTGAAQAAACAMGHWPLSQRASSNGVV